MDEDFAFMLIMAFWALLAYAVYQRFWVIRRLRRQLARGTDAALDPAAARQPAGPLQVEPGELRRIQQRLQVLERIAVEKENALAREIEELRDAG